MDNAILELKIKRAPTNQNITYSWKAGDATKKEILETLDQFKEILKDAPEDYWRNMGP